ncbi:MAG TPA: fumarylacetoacetate hydrolase family protein [Ensifer sp.]|nr:fumarylacetoacetate hydrolase family protein [Ensifer sp.]
MKLSSIQTSSGETRTTVLLQSDGRELLIDINRAYTRLLRERRDHGRAQALADALASRDMLELIEGGDDSLRAIREALDYAMEEIRTDADQAVWIKAQLAYDLADVRWLPPVPRPGKIISVGANYRVHLEEFKPEEDTSAKGSVGRGLASAKTPPAFGKMPSGLTGHESSIAYPRWTNQLDYEAELGIVIGKRSKNLTKDNWNDAVFGYMNVNDVSMRETQFEEMARGTLMLGKNADGACPSGPYVVTKDEVGNPQDLRIQCWVNGEKRQDDSTIKMIFDIPAILMHYSQMTLFPGDVFTTGSPGGVGIVHRPPEPYLLKVGDTIEIEIEGLGRLRNTVVADTV